MALTPPGITSALVSNMVSTGHLGTALPQFCQGVSNGVMLWVALVKVQTADAGTAGVGSGTTLIVIPQPVLLAQLSNGFAAQGIMGPFAPLTVLGLSTGLSIAFAQGQAITTHPSVGAGAGVATFKGPPAAASMLEGFAAAGMAGPGTAKIATAIGLALDAVFSALVLPTPIAGPPSTSPSSGVGSGQIV